MKKTITEIANELSISRQAVHQSLDKVLDKNKLEKKGNSYLLNNQEQKLIFDYFNRSKTADKNSEESTEMTSCLITSLQEQNQFLQNQLEVKNKQINELHILLLKEKEYVSISQEEDDKRHQKTFWQKFFRK